MFHRFLSTLLAGVLLLVLVACGGDSGEGDAAQEGGAAPTTQSGGYPVTVPSGDRTLTVAEAPRRIVSLSPTATESLFAIGAGEQVVAVDDQSTYPEEAPRTKLSGFQPNIEAIAAYEPDLVVAADDSGGLVAGLEKLQVPVLVQDAPRDLTGAYEQIEHLGAVTGRTDEAGEVVADLRERVEAAVEAVPDGIDLSVYHELTPDYYTATSETFIGSVYEELEIENIADEAQGGAPDYPQLSAEFILRSDPDLVVLADTKCCGQSPETVAERPGWKTMSAVERGAVVAADDDVASRWGPRIADFVEQIVATVEELGGA